jgi:hypothetical protein
MLAEAGLRMMPIKYFLFGVLLIVSISCGETGKSAKPQATISPPVKIELGMTRFTVEKLVSDHKKSKCTYSLYGNNLTGGMQRYDFDSCVLVVMYKRGSPAPWVPNAQGNFEHFQPVDETVTEFRFENPPTNH